ncbi:hypothetical protein BKA70DRAFT_1445725 [Coprinopsis sp. MPI-PUGE-AT-0042]|nr:hypothetical protein BKA70DRAFT_1445725 [Coprinopsis sp. MPI-PUGE-AT-0042]
MQLFSFKSLTRSGRPFRAFPLDPIDAPSVGLPSLLQAAVQRDEDDEMEFEEPELPQDAPRQSHKRALSSAACEDVGDDSDGDLEGGEHASVEQSRKSLHRKKKRNERITLEGHQPKLKSAAKHCFDETPLEVEIDLASLPSSSCGYRAYDRAPKSKQTVRSLDALVADGYTVVKWDGQATRPIVDPETGRIFMVLVSPPGDPSYQEACTKCFELLRDWSCKGTFTVDELQHRRGAFPAVNISTSYGQGSKRPGNLKNRDEAMARDLLRNPHVQRIAAFASGELLPRSPLLGPGLCDAATLSTWAPGFYHYAKTKLDSLFAHMPNLRRNFLKSVYPRAAFNLGDDVCTFVHLDVMNCPFGWCSIQALGTFDHTKGGHLVLPDLKLVIEFPSTTLIFMPSATLRHANTPIQKGESRASFTQYCPGGLFRYVDNGFKTEKQLKASDPDRYEEVMALKESRWETGLGLWSKLGDVVQPVEAV